MTTKEKVLKIVSAIYDDKKIEIFDKFKNEYEVEINIDRYSLFDIDKYCLNELIRIKPEPTYTDLQAEWVKANDLKVGDKVRIVRTFQSKEQGFDFASIHEGYVNLIFDVSRITEDAIWAAEGAMPFFAIEKVKQVWRPYKEVKKEWIGKVIKSKDKEEYFMITGVRSNGNYQTIWRHNDSGESVINCFDYYTWEDGSPFGEQDEN